MHRDPIVIVSMARTPIGGLLGALKDVTAPYLGAKVIKAAVERAALPLTDIEAVIMGCVLSAGLGQAPARQAALHAGLSMATDCTTVNKMCGSGMKAIMLAHDLLLSNTNTAMIAGGMESMSNAPYLLEKARAGYRMGHGELADHMFIDGLEDAYEKGRLMGSFAEDCAKKYNFSRAAQDQYAIQSLRRAQQAMIDNSFAAEIIPVTVKNRQAETIVSMDEQPGNARIDKIPSLRPAFSKNGTITAANASSISDGAAAVLLMRQSEAKRRGLTPLAVIAGHATHSQAPHWFTTAPIGAIKKLLQQISWNINEVDLFEINEAFAVVAMAAIHELGLSPDKVNIQGGACALGHPIGASGARIIVTLLAALKKYNLRRGIAALCIGGGEATALAIELI